MSWGRRNRLSRIVDAASGRTNMLAVDHGYFLGPVSGIRRPAAAIAPLLPHADALMATRGLLRACVDPALPRSVVLRVSGGTSIAGPSLADETIVTSVEDALRINASAVALSVFVGTEHERQTLAGLANLVDEAGRYDLPVLAVTAVGKELGNQDARYLALAVRICAELGADMVKTYYTEGFESIVESAMVPVVVAGGKKLDSVGQALSLAGAAVRAGAAGIDFGRNVWQSDHPVASIRSLRAVVHDGLGDREALDLYERLAAGERPTTGQVAVGASG
jgi:3-hydroxy-5-phosphonooxypentane-2,4-dione thiolase